MGGAPSGVVAAELQGVTPGSGGQGSPVMGTKLAAWQESATRMKPFRPPSVWPILARPAVRRSAPPVTGDPEPGLRLAGRGLSNFARARATASRPSGASSCAGWPNTTAESVKEPLLRALEDTEDAGAARGGRGRRPGAVARCGAHLARLARRPGQRHAARPPRQALGRIRESARRCRRCCARSATAQGDVRRAAVVCALRHRRATRRWCR